MLVFLYEWTEVYNGYVVEYCIARRFDNFGESSVIHQTFNLSIRLPNFFLSVLKRINLPNFLAIRYIPVRVCICLVQECWSRLHKHDYDIYTRIVYNQCIIIIRSWNHKSCMCAMHQYVFHKNCWQYMLISPVVDGVEYILYAVPNYYSGNK